MLIQFSVKNYRSIKDEAELKMITDAGKELLDSNTFQPDAKGANSFGLMKSAAIYGANAAGKSNITKALSKMQWLILNSATQLQCGWQLDIEPFKFSTDCIGEPTEFNMDFISKGIRYQYGFSANNERVLEEWLFAYPNGRAQTWFIREYDPENTQYNWSKDSYLAGTKSTWKDATRDNALFLSTAIQLNSKQLAPIYQWFCDMLKIVDFQDTFNTPLDDSQSYDDVLAFLKIADLYIEDIRVSKESTLPANSLKLETGHRMEDGSLCYLDLNDESAGTQRVFAFAASIVQSLQDGAVIVIDDLSNSLHPAIMKFLVSLFNSSESNANNAQLVFTTHETSVLNQDIFRRDQVWFCEKNKAQSTTLYSLSSFKVRKGADNLARNYLSGKYGALPFIDESNLNHTVFNRAEVEAKTKLSSKND